MGLAEPVVATVAAREMDSLIVVSPTVVVMGVAASDETDSLIVVSLMVIVMGVAAFNLAPVRQDFECLYTDRPVS